MESRWATHRPCESELCLWCRVDSRDRTEPRRGSVRSRSALGRRCRHADLLRLAQRVSVAQLDAPVAVALRIGRGIVERNGRRHALAATHLRIAAEDVA